MTGSPKKNDLAFFENDAYSCIRTDLLKIIKIINLYIWLYKQYYIHLCLSIYLSIIIFLMKYIKKTLKKNKIEKRKEKEFYRTYMYDIVGKKKGSI